MESLMEMLKAKGLVTTCDFDPRQYLKPARENIKQLVKHKLINVLGCDGKA